MNQVPVKLGPLALLLTVISICLTVLAILTFSTARADLALAERYAVTVKTRYELEIQGQEFLTTAGPGETVSFEKDGMILNVALDEDGHVSQWTMNRVWKQDEAIENLWPGN